MGRKQFAPSSPGQRGRVKIATAVQVPQEFFCDVIDAGQVKDLDGPRSPKMQRAIYFRCMFVQKVRVRKRLPFSLVARLV